METRDVCNTKFDAELKKMEHYQKYPGMLPFVGSDYGGSLFKPFLIVAESFYFPSESTIHLDPDEWYSSTQHDLCQKEQSYINTCQIVPQKNEQTGEWDNREGHLIHIRLEEALMKAAEKEMNECCIPAVENMFRHAAYMNYYQRPGRYRLGLDPNGKDREVAKDVFEGILSIIEPEAVIFVSVNKVWKVVKIKKWKPAALGNIAIEHTHHPIGRRNRWELPWRGSTPKQILISFVREHVIRNPSEV